MADIGVHAAHLVEYVTGLAVTDVLADLASFVAPQGLDDDCNVLLRLAGGAHGAMLVSKVATGEENGLRLRVYGEKKSLYFNQEEPNILRVRAPRAPEETWKRGNPYVAEVSPAAARAARVPAGHPEGFVEGFAAVYRDFCETIDAVAAGAMPPEAAAGFPDVVAGVRGMKIVEAVVASARQGGVWTKV